MEISHTPTTKPDNPVPRVLDSSNLSLRSRKRSNAAGNGRKPCPNNDIVTDRINIHAAPSINPGVDGRATCHVDIIILDIVDFAATGANSRAVGPARKIARHTTKRDTVIVDFVIKAIQRPYRVAAIRDAIIAGADRVTIEPDGRTLLVCCGRSAPPAIRSGGIH